MRSGRRRGELHHRGLAPLLGHVLCPLAPAGRELQFWGNQGSSWALSQVSSAAWCWPIKAATTPLLVSKLAEKRGPLHDQDARVWRTLRDLGVRVAAAPG